MQRSPTAPRSTSTSRRVAALVAVGSTVAALLVYDRVVQAGAARALPWRDVTARLGEVTFPRPTGRLYRSRVTLADYLDAVMPGNAPPLPPIDFRTREAVLVAVGPRSSTGYRLRVVRIVEERGRILVTLREVAPALGDHVQPRITYPYRLFTLPRGTKPVYLSLEGR